MGDVRNHDISNQTVVWGAVDITNGIVDGGQAITPTRDRAKYVTKIRGNGSLVRAKLPGSSGTFSIEMDAESTEHQLLKRLSEVDDQLNNTVLPMVHTDFDKDTIITYSGCYIVQEADEPLGTEAASYTWLFQYESKFSTPTTGVANVVTA